MKNRVALLIYIFVFLFTALLFFVSCKNENGLPAGNSDNGTKYSDANGTFVVVSNALWHTAALPNGNTVFLDISGYSNADKVTVAAYGNGTQVDFPISTDNQSLFSTNGIGISVGESSVGIIFKQSTFLKAYRGTDTLKVTLTSGNLEF